MKYSFEDYESAALDALSPLKKESGGYLGTLKGYAGELGSEEGLKRFFVYNFPAVLVSIGTADYELAELGGTVRQTVRVDIVIGARSYRSQEEARGGEKGAYQVLMDVREKLHGNKLGLSIRSVHLLNEWELGSTPLLVLYGARYEIINDNCND